MRAACVDLTDVLGRGSAAQLRPLRSPAGPLLAPLDRALLELVWSDAGYPSRGAYRDTHRLTEHRHQAWAVDGAPYDPARAAAQARADAADFVARAAARVRAGGLCVVALDTELLGAALARGRRLARRGARRGRAGGAADRAARRAARRGRAGAGARAAGHVVGYAARPRDLERARRRAGSPGASGRPSCARVAAAPDVPDRALRELLALQSSDWAFLVARASAGAVPGRRAPRGTRPRSARRWRRRTSTRRELRNLAPHLAREALATP